MCTRFLLVFRFVSIVEVFLLFLFCSLPSFRNALQIPNISSVLFHNCIFKLAYLFVVASICVRVSTRLNCMEIGVTVAKIQIDVDDFDVHVVYRLKCLLLSVDGIDIIGGCLLSVLLCTIV